MTIANMIHRWFGALYARKRSGWMDYNHWKGTAFLQRYLAARYQLQVYSAQHHQPRSLSQLCILANRFHPTCRRKAQHIGSGRCSCPLRHLIVPATVAAA
jgi:hypothetical protein